jgi:hypothetical protein
VEYKGFERAFGKRSGIGNSIHCFLSRFIGASRRGNERDWERGEERERAREGLRMGSMKHVLFTLTNFMKMVISGATKALAR